MSDRLTIAGIGVVLGLIGVIAYVAATPIFRSWINVVMVQSIFTTIYLSTITVLRRQHQSHDVPA